MEEDDDQKLPAAVSAASAKEDDDERSEGDWSRQVNADEGTVGASLHDDSFRMESVQEEEPRPSSQPELSLKEKLVLRERQRRIETERARLKQQFALSNAIVSEASIEEEASASVADTLGEESIVAHPDEESMDQAVLGFNMERFLRSSDSFNPQLEPTDEMNPTEGGVLMERFLNAPVVVENAEVGGVQRSVSFDVNERHSVSEEEPPTVPASLQSFGEDINGSVDANASIQVQADEEDVAQPLTPIPSTDIHESTASEIGSSSTEPRVLGLTEADMQEMAAIDGASIGNAPPSEREEDILSEVGELADFGGPAGMAGNFSQDTPTTAQESASLISGNQSAPPASATSSDREQPVDQHSIDEIPTPSASSHLPISPGASANDIVTANPPSDIARDDITAPEDFRQDVSEVPQPTLEVDNLIGTLPDDSEGRPSNEGIVNRTLRPGMVKVKPPPLTAAQTNTAAPAPSPPVVVEGFDYDKNQTIMPRSGLDFSDSYRDLPDDGWAPMGQVHVSPTQMVHRAPADDEPMRTQPYGSIEEGRKPESPGGLRRHSSLPKMFMVPTIEERQPLLGDVPPEIITKLRHQSDSSLHHDHRVSFRDAVESVFSTVRSEDDHEKEIEINESEAYKESSVFERGKIVFCPFVGGRPNESADTDSKMQHFRSDCLRLPSH